MKILLKLTLFKLYPAANPNWREPSFLQCIVRGVKNMINLLTALDSEL